MSVPRNQVIIGDAGQQLAQLPTASVDMVLTSPPYFRLRDYHVPGQLGLECNVEEWVTVLRGIARQLHRVLVPTGSFWLNIADTYAMDTKQGAERKSLLLGPERLALVLIEDGWLLRNKIVWQKTNPMPSSVSDRLTCTWEMLYVFVKQRDYYFDLDAIRQPHTSTPPAPKPEHVRQRTREAWRGPNGDDASGLAAMKAQGRVGHPLGKNPGDVWRIASSSYRGAHHATFPLALADRAIRAGCPAARCTRCRQPWRRQPLQALGGRAPREVLSPPCDCGAPSEPGLVLDPFFGAGTTGVAATAVGLDWVGIELSPSFASLAEARIHAAPPTPIANPPPAA